jgi:TRAP-type C4-dicarboxylate transport system substrate-binding protein
MRPRATSLADLRGKRVRANNDTEADIFRRLGIEPAVVPLTETALAISSGRIDGAAAPPVPMVEFGIGRVAPHHYMLGTSSVPLALLMTKERLNSLPADVQAIIRKYSGAWVTENYARINDAATALIIDHLTSDAQRTVVYPSQQDLKTAQAVFQTIVDDYTAASPHNAALVDAARAEVAKLRGGD